MTNDPWVWSDPRWRDRVGDDVREIYREALRRSVDLRDTVLEDRDHSVHRAVFLVDVLNHLELVMGHDVSGAEDLWTLP